MRKYNDDYQDYSIEKINGEDFIFFDPDFAILRKRRLQMRLTQEEVAEIAKIQLRQYQRLESGERDISNSSFRIGLSVCFALKLDPNRFLPVLSHPYDYIANRTEEQSELSDAN